jgi:hypothetical protein
MRIKKFNEFDILDSISESRVYFLDDLSNKLRRMCYDSLGNVKQVISDRATNYIRRFKDYLK